MTTGLWFWVIGYDGPGEAERLETDPVLVEAHWSYIEDTVERSGRLLARGPLLTPDRAHHAGSVHVIAAADLVTATAWARDEPFHRSGIFASVEVLAFAPWSAQSMWDRPGVRGADSWLAIGRAEVGSDIAGDVAGPEAAGLLCGGWLLDDARTSIHGVALVMDCDDAEAREIVEGAFVMAGLGAATITVWPWRRGGRPRA